MKPRGFEFEEILVTEPGKSWFDLSYKNKFTANYGLLYPFYLEETMPGDHFKINSTVFARLQPLLAPVMQQCDIFSYFFYVPNRLIWSNWKKFASNGDGTVKMVNAASYVPPEHPYIVPWNQLIQLLPAAWDIAVKQRGSNYQLCVHDGTDYVTNKNFFTKLVGLLDFLGVSPNFLQNPDDVVVLGVGTLSSSTWTCRQRYSIFCPPVGTAVSVGTAISTTGYVVNDLKTATYTWQEQDKVNALPFYAYNKVFNEFFRSQDYMDEKPADCVDGFNQDSFKLLSKSFEHDYFTSILPDCQRGPDVTIGLNASEAPLFIKGTSGTTLNYPGNDFQAQVGTYHDLQANLVQGVKLKDQVGSVVTGLNVSGGTSPQVTQIDITPHTKVDLSGVSAVTINALRYANTLQKYEEMLARSGSRYNEMLLAIYGVESSDASIQRPIFLGASRTPISISDVAQTSSTEGDSPLAQLAGRGIAVGDAFTDFYCEESGWILGVLSVVPRTQYFQGINRHLRKKVNLDYPVPLFAHLGEQEVYKEELFCSGNDSDRNILGYLPRFSEFKYHSDELHSEMKDTLNYWTFSRKVDPADYSIGAVIDESFLRADTMNYDAFADTSSQDDHFILDVTNNVALERSLPEYSTPKL